MAKREEDIKSVYTAHSKHNFYARKIISAYVLEQGYLPFNPFMNWDYFMSDMVDRKLVVRANTNLVHRSDELWQFGVVSNGCYHELKLAMELGKKIRFFAIGKTASMIKEIKLEELTFEDELKEEYDTEAFRRDLGKYVTGTGRLGGGGLKMRKMLRSIYPSRYSMSIRQDIASTRDRSTTE